MLSPYNYQSPDDGISYHFTTKNRITFSLSISDYSHLFGLPTQELDARVMFFVIEPINPPKTIPPDLRVRDTVLAFLIAHLEAFPDLILYVCSARGGKEMTRTQKFNRWFNAPGKPDTIMKIQLPIENNDYHFIYRSDNPIALQILDEIQSYLNS